MCVSCKLAIMLVPGPNYSAESWGKCETTSDANLRKLLNSRQKCWINWLNGFNLEIVFTLPSSNEWLGNVCKFQAKNCKIASFSIFMQRKVLQYFY